MNGFVAFLLQLHTWDNAFNTSTVQLPSEFSSTDGRLLTPLFDCPLCSEFKLILWLAVSRPVCLGIKHPSGAKTQIFITVRKLQACWCGALSLTRGRVYPLPQSQSAVISLSTCTIYILHVMKCIYIQHIQDLCQSTLSMFSLSSQSQSYIATGLTSLHSFGTTEERSPPARVPLLLFMNALSRKSARIVA
jgi:hypothetical protein